MPPLYDHQLPLCGKCQSSRVEVFTFDCPSCERHIRSSQVSENELQRLLRQFDGGTFSQYGKVVDAGAQHGIKHDSKDWVTDCSPLHFVAKAGAYNIGDDESASLLAEDLLRKGADVNKKTKWTDMTPIHYAAYFGSVEVLRVLVRRRAQPNSVQPDVNATTAGFNMGTSLHLGVLSSFVEVVRTLLKAGADRHIPDGHRKIPLDIAREMLANLHHTANKEDVQEIIKLLEEDDDSSSLSRGFVPISDKNSSLRVLSPQVSRAESPTTRGLTPTTRSPLVTRRRVEKKPAPLRSARTRRAGQPAESPKKEEEPDDIDVGDRVRVDGKGEGIVRFKGPTNFKPGRWYGIQLDQPKGINNGSVGSVKYFRCKPKMGVFVKRPKLTILQSGPKSARAKMLAKKEYIEDSFEGGVAPFTAPTLNLHTLRPDHGMATDRETYELMKRQREEREEREEHDQSPPSPLKHVDPNERPEFELRAPVGKMVGPFGLHSRILVDGLMGTVLYIGPCHLGPDETWIGVEVTEHHPKRHNGTLNGHTYFKCKPGHGILVHPDKINWHGRRVSTILHDYDAP